MDKFFSDIQKPKKQSERQLPSDSESQNQDGSHKNVLPKGVVLGKDGKPCRSCSSFSAWAAMIKQQEQQKNSSSTTTSSSPTSSIASAASSSLSEPTAPILPANCPPDVERLGSSTWTFLHTLSSAYPPSATPAQQSDMKQFLTLFSKLYPCWHCAEDFQAWMARRENQLDGQRLKGRGGLMRWMCEAHNEVNVKLGKPVFDCSGRNLEERWGDGPGDGSCG